MKLTFQSLFLILSFGALGIAIAYLLNVLDLKLAITLWVSEMPIGILLHELTQEKEKLSPEVRVIIPEITPEQQKKISEEEERLRKEYPRVFIFFDSIPEIKTQNDYDRLDASGRILIQLEFMSLPPFDMTTQKVLDQELLETLLRAKLIAKKNIKPRWWES